MHDINARRLRLVEQILRLPEDRLAALEQLVDRTPALEAAPASALPSRAAWFERTATSSQIRTIYKFKTDQLKVFDDFEPI